MKKIILFTIAALNILIVSKSFAEEANQNVGYKDGFFIKSSDNGFQFIINGRLQPQVYYTRTGSVSDNWTFGVRRARMDFLTKIKEKTSIVIQTQYSTASADFKSINLYNALIKYKFMDELNLAAGTVGIPLGFMPTSTGLLMTEPALCKTQKDGGKITPLGSPFGNPDGLGLEAFGKISKFFYDFSLVNGAAEAKPATKAVSPSGGTVNVTSASGGVETNYDLNFNKHVSAGLRVGYNIFDPVPGIEMDYPYSTNPKLTVSVGGDFQGARTDPNNNASIQRILTGTIGAAFRWKGISVNTELFGRKTKFNSLGTANFGTLNLDDFGYYINGGYFVIKDTLELAGVVSQIFRQGPHNNSYQFGGAVNWYFAGNKLKLQTTYVMQAAWSDVTQEDPVRTQILTMMLTAAF